MRIIPARAGFTIIIIIYHEYKDHPRSRGVYVLTEPDGPVACGSSPLARGLPTHRVEGPLLRGIIPARAGFTPGSCRRGVRPADYPRSRGGYPPAAAQAAAAWGSSPLARGLLRRRRWRCRQSGIIPARAGFTRPLMVSDESVRDHPRSRGVYRPRCSRARHPGGSSPLARGLRLSNEYQSRTDGIIPARAGFTAPS